MHWVGVTHVRRHHQHYHHAGGGHLYQGRFKSFPVQDDLHFLTLCRYVEGNALRAGLCRSAQAWPWCSLHARLNRQGLPPLCPWPVHRSSGWQETVNEALAENELQRLRTSVNRGRPFGDDRWTQRTAARLGLDFTLRPVGRPRKDEK